MALEESGFEIRQFPGRAFLMQAFRQWTANIFDYMEVHSTRSMTACHDAPYAYNERVNVSLLAAAFWRSGGVAIQDYAGARRGKKRAEIDLFASGFGAKSDLNFEAKMAWPTLREKKTRRWTIAKRKLDSATNDAKKITGVEGSRIGLAIICPRVFIPKNSQVRSRSKLVEEFCESILEFVRDRSEIECDAVAWAFPKRGRRFWAWDKKERHFFPGVILLMRRV